MILDVAELYGQYRGQPEGFIDVQIEDMSKDQKHELIRAAEAEVEPAKIPSVTDVNVIVRACLVPTLGVRDVSAAIRLDLDMNARGFSMLPDDRAYHRPDCDLVAGKDSVVRALTNWGPNEGVGRIACEKCNPDKWDIE